MEIVNSPHMETSWHFQNRFKLAPKVIMDALFGWQQYQATIAWRRTSAHNDSRRFGRVTDNILFYSRSLTINADAVRIPLDADYVERFYRFEDERGKYQLGDLTAPRLGTGETGQPWRGYDPNLRGRQWNAPLRGRYAAWIEEHIIPGYRSITSPLARLDALDAAGLIAYPADGTIPRLKRYLAENPGQVPTDQWTDIRPVSAWARERTGWRTQKPVALLERIILASSNPGDLALDPFCGCATACIAAEKLGRQWIGIDILPQAAEVLTQRAKRELQIPMNGDDERPWEDWTPMALQEPPRRNELTLLTPANPQSDRELLYASQNRRCIGCEYELPLHALTIDHITPRSRGGMDAIGNLQLMCHTCNAIKGNRDMAYLKQQLQIRGILSI